MLTEQVRTDNAEHLEKVAKAFHYSKMRDEDWHIEHSCTNLFIDGLVDYLPAGTCRPPPS